MKKLLLMAVALLGTYAAQAQTISVEDVLAVDGKNPAIQVNIANTTGDERDAQFTFVVPTGVTIGTPAVGSATDNAGSGAYAVALSDPSTVTGGTQYTAVVYSEQGEFFNDGVVLNIPVEIPADFSDYWNETTHALSGIHYTVDDATETTPADDAYKFQVGLIGDVDKSSGVDFFDISEVLNYIADPTTVDAFALTIADLVDNKGTIDFFDISAILDIIAANSSSSVKGEAEFVVEPIEAEDWAD